MTQHFPFAWMGGNSAMRQLKDLCESKGNEPFATCIVNWSNETRRKKKTADAVGQICSRLKS
jgi:hypothetical protein